MMTSSFFFFYHIARMTEEPKKRGKDPEFMAKMREKAAAKKAEQRKIKEAEIAKKKSEHATKLKEAESILNPKPVVESEPEPEPLTVKAPPKAAQKEPTTNYKQEYYKHKLELLKSGKHDTPKHEQPLPHKLLKQEFMNDINKTVMKELWTRHFGDNQTPYD
jgi:hypothetical protein